MTISSKVQIGDDEIDITRPCDVLIALQKAELQLMTGGKPLSIEVDGEKVVFSNANAARLQTMIEFWRGKCERARTGRRSRYAAGIRWV